MTVRQLASSNTRSDNLASLSIVSALVAWQFLWSVRINLQDFDSTYEAALSYNALRTSSIILGFRSEFLLGFGGIEWGTLRWLEPVSLIGVLGARFVNAGMFGGSVTHLAFASSTAVVLMWLSTYFLTRSFDISKTHARLSATLAVAIGIGPGLTPVLLPDQFRIVPPFATFASASAIVVGAAVRMNRVKWKRAAITYFLSLTYLLLVHTHYIVLPGFVCGVAILAVLLTQMFRREPWIRLFLTTTFCIVTWWITGVITYVLGFMRYVAAVEYGDRYTWNYVSIRPIWSLPFRSVFVRPELMWLATTAAAICAMWLWKRIRRRNSAEQTAAVILASLVLAVTIYRVSQRWWPYELGPEVGYLSWTFIPIVAIAFSGGLLDLTATRNRALRYMTRIIVTTVLLMGVIQSWPEPQRVAPFPDKLQLPWSFVEAHTSLLENPRFRGRTAVIRQMEQSGVVAPERFFTPEVTILAGIPLLNHYSHLQTPTGLEFSQRFLFRKGDPQIRNLPGFRQINSHILQLLGVRFIVTDSKQSFVGYESVFSWTEQRGRDVVVVHILESSNFNDGSFSPTNTLVTNTLREGLDLLGDPGIDLKTTAVVGEDNLSSLTKADRALLDYVKGDLHVRGSSVSRSLLVIPVEFSRCWTITPRNGSSTDVRLIRVNVLQMGVLFSGSLDADLRYRFWPMRNGGCRSKDLHDHRAGFP